MELNCKNLVLVHKKSSSNTAGIAEVYVDGKLVDSIDSFDNGGWNNPYSRIIINDQTARKHKVEVKMQKGDEKKDFTILAFGYTK